MRLSGLWARPWRCCAGRRSGRSRRPDTTDELLREATELMSSHAGVVRSRQSIAEALARVKAWLDSYATTSSADAGQSAAR